MKHRFGFVPAIAGALTLSMTLSTVAAQSRERPIRRNGPEWAADGKTVEEQAALRQQLYRELTSHLPAAGDASPVVVATTARDVAAIDERSPSGTAPLRVGIVLPIPGSLGKPSGQEFRAGIVQQNGDGSLVWAVRLESPGAQAVRIHLTDVFLPPDAAMYFLGNDGQAHGPYRGTGPDGNGDFWTRSVAASGGTILLRYDGTALHADLPLMSFTLAELGHIRGRDEAPVAKGLDTWPCGSNAACLIDVNCVDTGPAALAEDAVAKMEWIQGQFIYTCTGGLLADTEPTSQVPYFLTANHCLATNSSNLETFFNYTTGACNGVCPNSIVNGGPVPPASTVGVTLIATGSTADFSLLRLNQAPPAGAVFLGWNNTPIHNVASADLFRISNPNFGPQVFSRHDVDPSSPVCGGWPRGPRIYSQDAAGATMGGSSGSPVVNSAGEVVGQLSGCCGFNCNNQCDPSNNWTVDGAFASYWAIVAPFLDPEVDCTSDEECGDGVFCNGVEICSGGACQSGTTPCPPGSTCNEATDTCQACGDGTVQAGEQCDDGNTSNGDGCDSACRLEVCGNGILQSGEQCDDGNVASGDGCSAACVVEFCGDGTIQAGLGEQCDGGNTTNGDGCDSNCKLEVCGNGIVQAGEACDDGNANNSDGCANDCTIPPVTNLIVNGTFSSGTSQWTHYTDASGTFTVVGGAGRVTFASNGSNVQLYQRNIATAKNTPHTVTFRARHTVAGQKVTVRFAQHLSPYTYYGLSQQVTLTTTMQTYTLQFTTTNNTITDGRLMFLLSTADPVGSSFFVDDVTLAPTVQSTCGNGVINAGEVCDGANLDGETCATQGFTAGTLACNATCSAFVTTSCTTCGNGVVQSGEQCDDGNTTNGDGCSSTCQTEGGGGPNLVVNGNFSAGTSGWSYSTDASSTFSVVGGEAFIDVNTAGTTVQLYRAGITLQPNKTYRLTFRGRNTVGRDVKARIIGHTSPYTEYKGFVANLTPTMQTFTTTFTTPAGALPQMRLQMWIGPYDANGADYFFDDFVLELQ